MARAQRLRDSVIRERVLAAIGAGAHPHTAAESCGVSSARFDKAIADGERDVEDEVESWEAAFYLDFRAALGVLEAAVVQSLAASEDWRARDRWLKIVNPARYRETQQVDVGVSMTREQEAEALAKALAAVRSSAGDGSDAANP